MQAWSCHSMLNEMLKSTLYFSRRKKKCSVWQYGLQLSLSSHHNLLWGSRFTSRFHTHSQWIEIDARHLTFIAIYSIVNLESSNADNDGVILLLVWHKLRINASLLMASIISYGLKTVCRFEFNWNLVVILPNWGMWHLPDAIWT